MTRPTPHEGWLHLDLSAGARADVVAASLLDLGLSLDVVREALALVGLHRLDVVVSEGKRAGLGGRALRFLAEGVELPGPGQSALTLTPRALERHLRARRSRPHRHGPHAESAPRLRESVAAQAAIPGAAIEEDGHAQHGIANAAPKRAAKGDLMLDRWLVGTPATGAQLLEVVKESDLEPVAKALTTKAVRRLVDGLVAVRREPATSTSIPGRVAVRVLAELVAGMALVEALSPAGISASPIALSTALVPGPDDDGDEGLSTEPMPGPSPWVLAILEGVPTNELALPDACTTPAGAALAWSIAHRFGVRGFPVVERMGTGLFPLDVPGRAAVSRALWGRPRALATRMGDAASSEELTAHVSSTLSPMADVRAITTELHALGALSVSTWAATTWRGDAVLHIEAVVPHVVVDAATRALWTTGMAPEVSVSRCERHTPGVREVTVPVGHSTKRGVRVLVHTDRGHVLRAEPSPDDLREAARETGLAIEALRMEALAAYARLDDGASVGVDP